MFSLKICFQKTVKQLKQINYPEKPLLTMIYPNGTSYQNMTDKELVYLIDYEYYDSIGKLEREVGAGKNQLRNRYNKAKKRQKIERGAK